jgi:uncharacterized protein YecT (DUF1311 family)
MRSRLPVRPCFIVIALSGAGRSVSQAAPAKTPASAPTTSTCWDTATTQLDMDDCAEKDYETADTELNAVYTQTVAAAAAGTNWADGPTLKATLETAEKGWIAFRDADCDFAGNAQAEGGTMEPMLETQCGTDRTHERTRWLRALNARFTGAPVAPAPAVAASTERPEQKAEEDCLAKRPNDSSSATAACAQIVFKVDDGALNVAYQKLAALVAGFCSSDGTGCDIKAKLKTAELAWMTYRDADAPLFALTVEIRDFQGQAQVDHQSGLTEERTADLAQDLKDLTDK